MKKVITGYANKSDPKDSSTYSSPLGILTGGNQGNIQATIPTSSSFISAKNVAYLECNEI